MVKDNSFNNDPVDTGWETVDVTSGLSSAPSEEEVASVIDEGPDETAVAPSRSYTTSNEDTEDDDFEVVIDESDEFELDASEEGEEVEEDDNDKNDDTPKDSEERAQNKDEKKVPRSEKRIKDLIEKLKQVTRERDEERARSEAQYLNEIQKTRAALANRDTEYGKIALEHANNRLEAAKAKLRQARESMDTEAEFAANDELLDAKIAVNKARELNEQYEKEGKGRSTEEIRNISPEVIAANRNIENWKKANAHVVENPQLARLVAAVAKTAEDEGYVPSSYDYFTEVNRRVNSKFKELGVNGVRVVDFFGDDGEDGDTWYEETPAEQGIPDKKTKKRTVNPVTNSRAAPNIPSTKSSPSKKLTMSKAEADVIRSYGLDPKDVLRQRVRAEKSRTASGWEEVTIVK